MAGQLLPYSGTVTGQVGSLITALDTILLTAGWTKTYSGANLAAYYNTGASGAHCYLRVADDASGTGGAQEALITGYETMSDVNTGTGPFPTTALGAGGAIAALPVRKSASANATARTWLAFADAATLYLFILTGDVANGYGGTAFGKFDSKSATDTWCNWIVSQYAQNSSANVGQFSSFVDSIALATLDGAGRGCVQRTYTGVGAAVSCRRYCDTAMTPYTGGGGTYGYIGIGILPYPNGPDVGLYMSQLRLGETSSVFRGIVRGVWASCHPTASFNDGDTFSGTDTLAGKTFRVIKTTSAGAPPGLWIIETSATLSNP